MQLAGPNPPDTCHEAAVLASTFSRAPWLRTSNSSAALGFKGFGCLQKFQMMLLLLISSTLKWTVSPRMSAASPVVSPSALSEEKSTSSYSVAWPKSDLSPPRSPTKRKGVGHFSMEKGGCGWSRSKSTLSPLHKEGMFSATYICEMDIWRREWLGKYSVLPYTCLPPLYGSPSARLNTH